MDMEKTLVNGVTLIFLDESKRVAGDRWLVKLRCRVSTPLHGWMREALAGSDPQTLFCRERLGECLCHETVMERNFIDEAEREGVFAEMVRSLEETMLSYFSAEGFGRQLFAKRLAEATQDFSLQGQTPILVEDEDPPGPADFSACFR